jgi:hypothetical protein
LETWWSKKYQEWRDSQPAETRETLPSDPRSRFFAPQPIPPEILPDRWQAYCDYMVLLLPEAGLRRLDARQLAALVTAASLGIRLIPLDAAAAEHLARAGAGQLRPLTAADLFDEPAADRSASTQGLNLQVGAREAEVPGTGRVPTAGFIILALVFTLLVGPGAFWWCLRRGRRTLLLVLTPLLSAGTCLALLIYHFASEGFDLKGSVQQLVLLDSTHHRAFVWNDLGWYAPFGISSLLLTDEDRFIPPMDVDPDWRYSTRYHGYGYGRQPEQPDLTVDWRPGQLLEGTLAPSRRSHRVIITQVRPLRDRLTVRPVGTGHELINGLPVAVLAAFWQDATGQRWHLAAPLAPGGRALLTRRSDGRSGPDVRLAGPGTLDQIAQQIMARCAFLPASAPPAGTPAAARQMPVICARLAAPLMPVPGPAFTSMDPDSGRCALLVGSLPVESEAGP